MLDLVDVAADSLVCDHALMDTTTINALPISLNVLIAFIARSSWATINPHRDRGSATTVQPDTLVRGRLLPALALHKSNPPTLGRGLGSRARVCNRSQAICSCFSSETIGPWSNRRQRQASDIAPR